MPIKQNSVHNIASQLRKKQFHKTFNIIAGKEEHENLDDKWRLVRKQHIEYPNYNSKFTEDELDKINEYNFKKSPSKVEASSSPSKKRDLQSYLKAIFSNSNEISEVVLLMKELLDARIDCRMLYVLRETLFKNSKDHNIERVSVEDFRSCWRTLMNQELHAQQPQLEFKFLSILSDKNGNHIDTQKLSKIIDLIEFYPFTVKKDRNFSQELYYVLSAGIQGDHNEGIDNLKKRKEKSEQDIHTEKVCEFVWSKIQEKFERLAEAFRFFDIDNNTKLTRKEFREGLERLKIKISDEDREAVFEFLDKNKNGWLSYKEF
jgi:hypothetical protein